VLVAGIRAPINIAAADIDGDGVPELALAHGFATTVAQSVGNVSLLTHAQDVTQPWTTRELDRFPTSHRVRFVRAGTAANEYWLVNAPLIGDTLRAPDYRGNTPLYMYRPPRWERELLSNEEQGVVHAIEVVAPSVGANFFAGVSGAGVGAIVPRVAVAGFLGVSIYDLSSRTERGSARAATELGSKQPWPLSGASEIAFPRSAAGTGIAATIEPWHGNTLVVYTMAAGAPALRRLVVDSTLTDAHTLIVADFDGDGRDELVAGERGGERSVKVYKADSAARTWTRTTLDAGRMAAAGCVAADLNMDGRVDLACIGTATANLKWYENVPR
jgi:hypothetical protein